MQKSGFTIFWSSSHFGPIRPPASSSKVKCSSTVPLRLLGDGLERKKREGVGGEVGLRDRNATPVHDAVGDLGAEGRMRPAFAGRDDVAMRVQRDHRSVAEAAAHDEVGCRDHAGGAHQVLRHDMALDLEPEPFEQLCRRRRRSARNRREGWRRGSGRAARGKPSRSSPRAAMSDRMRSFTTEESLMRLPSGRLELGVKPPKSMRICLGISRALRDPETPPASSRRQSPSARRGRRCR